MSTKKCDSDDFKRKALRRLESSGKTIGELEKELGLSHGLLR
jgi:transposase-like protein